jgi:hypothetical protein
MIDPFRSHFFILTITSSASVDDAGRNIKHVKIEEDTINIVQGEFDSKTNLN